MAAFRFGEFELDLERRTLSKQTELVKIGARAFDILSCLLDRAGEVVPKDELIRTVWPFTNVDDVALRVHMVALRKAISGDGTGSCIESIAGRGYQFVREVVRTDPIAQLSIEGPRAKSELPTILETIIGREDFLRDATELLKTASLLTIVGPGGIGKTTVAVEVARALETEYEQTLFLDLAALSNGAQVTPLLATRLGLISYSADPFPSIVTALADSRALLIFDNCEHVIDECADLIERLIGRLKNLTVIATSRESLRIRSENVRILPGLASPSSVDPVEDMHSYGAVELFVRRYEAANGNSEIGQEDLVHAAGIVSRLDGIPLAIELAAARASSLGIRAVLESLSDPINLLKRGRRTAPQRQQTLRATLEWSFSLLSPAERRLLEHLSVFAGHFQPSAAADLVGRWLSGSEFEDALAGLSAKSLVSVSRQDKRLRLLEVTRAFAREELAASGEEIQALSAHSQWVLERLGSATRDWAKLTTSDWMSNHSQLINDVRLAIAWAFESGRDDLALRLAASSHILWTQLALMGEQLSVLQRSVETMEKAISLDPLSETRLRASYAAVLFHLKSLTKDEEAIRQFRKATLTAEAAGDHIEIARTHSGICAILTTHGRYQEAMEVAARLENKFGAIGNNAVSRVYSLNLHYLGKFGESDLMCQRALEAGAENVRSTRTSGAGYDQRLMAILVLAKNAWIYGDTEAALAHSRDVVAEALNMGDPISTCLVLAVSSCVVYLGMGEVEAARHHIDILKDVSTRHSLARWMEWADGYQLLLPDSGATEADFERHFRESTPGARVEGVAVCGGVRVGSKVLDLALSGEAGWCRAELLRIKGESLVGRDPEQAKRLFLNAYEIAERQGARLWQLRAALSLLDIAPPSERLPSEYRVTATLGRYAGRPALAERSVMPRAGISFSGSSDGRFPMVSTEPNLSRTPY